MHTNPMLAGLSLLALAFAGCAGEVSNGPDGQTAIGEGSIAYNGASTGRDQSEFPCGDSAEVHVSSNLGSGQVKVTVKDANGATVYTGTMNSPGQDADSKTVNGAAGNGWLVIGERLATEAYGVSGFSGQYAAHVQC